MAIAHNNGKMTVTNAAGITAARKTDTLYVSAVVGKNAAGKLVVVYAGNKTTSAREALAKHNAGTFVSFKFREATDLEAVTATPADLAAIESIIAERVAAWEAAREQAAIDAEAAKWEPAADPDAWKAADAALIAARRK